jgi:hypothetical protein
MKEYLTERSKNRNRSRSFAISDELLERISRVTNDNLSVSAFVRMALEKEICFRESVSKEGL